MRKEKEDELAGGTKRRGRLIEIIPIIKKKRLI